MRARIGRWFAEQKDNGAPAAIAEVSMLYEGGAAHIYDVIVVVSADRATQLARFVERGGTPDEFNARLKHQLPLREKERKAQHIINNNGTREATREQVGHLWTALHKEQAGSDAAAKEGA